MKHALTSVSALLLSVAFLLTGVGLQGTLIPVRAGLEAFSTFQIGLLGTGYFIGFAAGCLSGPHLIRLGGHARAFLAMSAVASATPLLLALALSPWLWTVMRGMTGFCLAVLYITIESWLNERSTNETRGAVLSVYQTVNFSVLIIGMMLTTLYDPRGFELFLIASILVSLAAVPIGFTRASTPAPVQSVTLRIGRLFKLSPVGFVGCAVVGLTNGAFWALSPLYAQGAGMDVRGVALYMSATVLGGALAQWPVGLLSDKMDRRWIIMGLCLAGAAIGLALATFPTTSHVTSLLLSLAYGLFAFPIYVVCLAHTNDYVSSEEFVEVSSGLLLVFAAGAALGPLFAAGLIDLTGVSKLYVWTAVCHIALGGFALNRMRYRHAVPESERSEFAAAVEAAQTISVEFDHAAIEDDAHSPDVRDDRSQTEAENVATASVTADDKSQGPQG